MNTFRLVLSILLAQALCGCFSRASNNDFVVVATYSVKPEYAADGARLIAILKAHHIEAVCPQSAGVSVDVPASQATEARKLISEAIAKEHLRVQVSP